MKISREAVSRNRLFLAQLSASTILTHLCANASCAVSLFARVNPSIKSLKPASTPVHRETGLSGLSLLKPLRMTLKISHPGLCLRCFKSPFSPSGSTKKDIWRSRTTANISSHSPCSSSPTAKMTLLSTVYVVLVSKLP